MSIDRRHVEPMTDNDILWQPSEDAVRGTQMYAFMMRMAEAYGFEATWPELHRWSCEHRDIFWQEMFNLAGIEAMHPATTALLDEGMVGSRWFPGMKLNYAAHLLRHTGAGKAIIALDERDRSADMSWDELRHAVKLCAGALKQAGVTRGDRVVAFIPNIPEAVIAMLATASLGAIWSSCSPDFGINGVIDRFGQIEPKVLITVDGYTYGGKPIDLRARVAEIVERLDGLETVVVAAFLEDHPDITHVPLGVLWDDFFKSGEDYELSFDPVPFDHPLFIMYSSGTTGVPKCIVHGHGGTLLQHMKEHMLHCDLHAGDTMFYFTTCGWMMWNWVTSSLGVGATLVTYEGSPGYPDLNRLWRLIESSSMVVFGTSPKFLTTCEKNGIMPAVEFDMSRLRCMLSTGSPLTVENFQWVYRNVKRNLQLSSISGGTDIISCFMLGNPMLPVRAGEIQCLGLGMDVVAFDDDGEAVTGAKGELVCRSPFPSQPVGFWNDEDGSRYRAAYFDHFPGAWRHGDFIEITEHGGVIVYGRSDATLNPGGVRIGTAEIYRIVEALDEIADSIVVGRPVDDDVEVCLFVVLQQDVEWSDGLEATIRRVIADGATKRHVPKHIHAVPAIPYTISGKKVELAVVKMLCREEVNNRDALANPEALAHFADIIS